MATKFASGLVPGSTLNLSLLVSLVSLIFLSKPEVISHFLSPSSDWDFHFRRNLRDIEVAELFSLLVRLQNFCLSPSCPDVCIWSLTSSSLFSVSSFSPLFLPPHPRPLSPTKLFGLLRFPLKSKRFFGKLFGIVRPSWISSNPSTPTLPCWLMFVLFVSQLRNPLTIFFYPLPLHPEPLRSYLPASQHFLCTFEESG